MAYSKLNLANGTKLTDEHLAHIESGIENSAPAGYGLGTVQPIEWSAVDNITSNGWYSAIVNGEIVTGLSAYMVWIRADGLDTNYACQTLYATGSTAILVRYKQGGTWSDWEWLTPPMVAGVEYRTTERWQGKPVYVKMVDCGSLPNATTKYVSWCTVTTGYVPISCSMVAYNSATGGKRLIPLNAGGAEVKLTVTGIQVITTTSADWSEYATSYATVKYIKETTL